MKTVKKVFQQTTKYRKKFCIKVMDKNMLMWLTKYLMTRVLIVFLIYQTWTNKYISSSTYRYLKNTFYELNFNNEVSFCLLKNPFSQKPAMRIRPCSMCESVHNIKKLHDTTYNEVQTLYLNLNIPVIVTDAMFDWSVLTDDLSIFNFTQVYRQPHFHHNIPCELKTNINLETKYISDFLETLAHPLMENWFIFWKNCDLSTAKAARYFYEQPYFTKYFIPAAKINWVLMSSNYKSVHFKQFQLPDEKLIMLMQLQGSQEFKLIPQGECIKLCSSIHATLEEFQILIFNSDRWQLWYSFGAIGINIAILTENDLKL